MILDFKMIKNSKKQEIDSQINLKKSNGLSKKIKSLLTTTSNSKISKANSRFISTSLISWTIHSKKIRRFSKKELILLNCIKTRSKKAENSQEFYAIRT